MHGIVMKDNTAPLEAASRVKDDVLFRYWVSHTIETSFIFVRKVQPRVPAGASGTVFGARGAATALSRATAILAAFSGPQGTVATAQGEDPSTQILMTVTAVRDQPTGGVPIGEDEQIAQVANSAGDDILDQMVGQLQAEYGVTINQALAQQAIVR